MLPKRFSLLLGPLSLYFATINALTISADSYMNNGDISEDITVDEGIFLAMVNGNIETMEHSLTVKGSLYIGDTNADDTELQATFSGSDLVNDGLTVIDGRNITSGSVSINFGGTSIVNNGKMFFNGPNSNSNSFNLNPTSSLDNKGLIVMGQDENSGYSSTVHIKSGSITNDGTICLKNVKAYLDSSISGNGCITISDNTVYAIQSKRNSGTLGPQTLYMTSPSSIIYVDSAGVTDNIMIRGFGGGNYLSFGTSIVSHSYNSDTGILKLSIFLFISHKFNIGKGYDSSKFSMKQIDNHIGLELANNALYYTGDDPNGIPSACLPCESGSWIPVTSVAPTTTSVTITSTNYATTSVTSTPPKPVCRLTTTMAVTEAKIQNLELSAYVRDILSNMGQYLSFRQANPDQPYPTQLNQIVMNAMFAGSNDGWTSSLTGIDPNTVEMMLTGVPWYSTRILPVLQKNLDDDGIYVDGINSNACAFKTSSSSIHQVPASSSSSGFHFVSATSSSGTHSVFATSSSSSYFVSASSSSANFVSITSSTPSLSNHTIVTSKNTNKPLNPQSELVPSSHDVFTSTVPYTTSISTSSNIQSKWNHTFEASQSTAMDRILVSSTSTSLDISSIITPSAHVTETSSTFSSSINCKDNTSSSKETVTFHNHASMTKVTTVITTGSHVVTLTTIVPCSFSNSDRSSSQTQTSVETQASLIESVNINPATEILSTWTISTNSSRSTQHFPHNDASLKLASLSTKKATVETTETVYVTSKQTSTQSPPFANKTLAVKTSSSPMDNYLSSAFISTSPILSKTNGISTAVNNPRTYEIVYPGDYDSGQTKKIPDQTRKASSKPVTSSTVISTQPADVQQQNSSNIINAATTVVNEHASGLTSNNRIGTKISVQLRITSLSSYTSRMSIQQNVNSASQKKSYSPLYTVFLLFTFIYI